MEVGRKEGEGGREKKRRLRKGRFSERVRRGERRRGEEEEVKKKLRGEEKGKEERGKSGREGVESES